MARFLLEKNGSMDLESVLLKESLALSHAHTFDEVSIDGVPAVSRVGVVPVGSLGFVSKCLNLEYGIKGINPIEVPKYLREDFFLKRKYEIVNYKSIPRKGKFFIKDVSKVKSFNVIGNALDVIRAGASKDSLYLVSGVFDIRSEWRVYVIGGKIANICCYAFDRSLLSIDYPDMSVVLGAIGRIGLNEDYLKSYTLDVMVGEAGTAVIEVHNWVSVGLYSTLWGQDLPYAYMDGMYYLLKDNREVTI